MKKTLFDTHNGSTVYKVPVQTAPISGVVAVPGSKSITNRALLLAALAKGPTTLTGVLFSDDSRHFLGALQAMGFDVAINEGERTVTVVGLGGQVPVKKANIHVGSAGTAARFLTAMLALSDGDHVIQCTPQMKSRPMKPLFDALTALGAEFDYLERPEHLPVRVRGNHGLGGHVAMDITKSTQFLSALLMMGPMLEGGLSVQITSPKKDGAYIRITTKMMAQFGGQAHLNGDTYLISPDHRYTPRTYAIEPDMSAACYFYAMATLTGGQVTVKGVHRGLMQGDVRFLEVLEALGSKVTEASEGLRVTGPKDGDFSGIDVDMNDFSDQTMTLAALAPFATSPTTIRHVAHIRLQECNRMEGIVQELTRAGISVQADGANIVIEPGFIDPTYIRTYDDHRFAMAFTLLGLRAKGIAILDPMCCRKTFENYFEVVADLIEQSKDNGAAH